VPPFTAEFVAELVASCPACGCLVMRSWYGSRTIHDWPDSPATVLDALAAVVGIRAVLSQGVGHLGDGGQHQCPPTSRPMYRPGEVIPR
jgi:hypothetical protein